MASRGWRYIAVRLTGDGSDEFLDLSVPLSGVKITDTLSGHNGLEGTITPRYRRMIGSDGLPIISCWRTAIFADYGGDIRGGGIVTDISYSGPSLAVTCTGYTGYLAGMPWTGAGEYFVKADPLDIYRSIWAHEMAQPNSDLGLSFDSTDTGGKVTIGTELKQAQYDSESGPYTYQSGPYKLNWYTNTDLGSDIDTLASNTPFDYHERHYWKADGTLAHHVDLGYPRIGRRRDDLRFVIGENIFVVPDLQESGDDYATDAVVLGAGSGAAMKHGLANRKRTGLRRVAVVTNSSLKTQAAVDQRAQAEVNWRKSIDEISEIEVRDHPHARLGSVGIGDDIRIQGRFEWRDVNAWFRVTQIGIEPDNGNSAVYTLTRTDKLTS